MLIRCDKCGTLYELDEKLLPRQGAPVQCSKCQYVFTAYPVAATPPPEPALEEPPQGEAPEPAPDLPAPATPAAASTHPQERLAAPSGASSAPARERLVVPPASDDRVPGMNEASPDPTDEEGMVGATPAEPSAPRMPRGAAVPSITPPPAHEPQFTKDGRPIRKVAFPAEDYGTTPSRPAPPRPSAIPNLPRKALVWLVPIGIALLILVGLVGWWLFGRRSEAPAQHGSARGAFMERGAAWASLPSAAPPGAPRVS